MSVAGNPYGFYPDRSKYPLANLDGQLQPAAHNHVLNNITNVGDLDDRYALKNHQHNPGGLILPNGLTTGNVTVKQDSLGNYIFDIENNEPTGDSEIDAVIKERVRKELERMHMPEGDVKVMEFDEWEGVVHSRLYYWLKGGLIVWNCLSHPQFPSNHSIEVKNIGYFEYPDGSPCPYYHTFGHLHYHHIDGHAIQNAFLCHPVSWNGAAPVTSVVAMHKRAVSGDGGWPGYNAQTAPEGLALTGCGVFVMTGEHYRNDGTEQNPIWVKDRDAWVSGENAQDD